MGPADVFEQPFRISGEVCRGASSSLRRSQKCGRAPAGAEGIDEYSSSRLWEQDRNVPFGKVEMSPLISDRSLPFPLAPIVLLAAEPVKASLRRAKRRRAALTKPAASGTHFSDQEG